MADRKLNIILTASDMASGTLAKTADTIGGKLKGVSIAGAAVGTAVSAGLYKAVGAAKEAEMSQKKLENAIIGVSGGTKEQVNSMSALADSLEKKIGIDGDAAKVGIAQLGTFQLQSSTVDKLSKSLVDLTINQSGLNATAGDYEASAGMIAKALNGQFGLLEKSQIYFTDAQKELIQFGTETEKVAAIQEGFAQNLKYTSDNVAESDSKIAVLTQSFGNIQEKIGTAVLPALLALTQAIVPIMDKFAKWAEENPNLVAGIIAVTLGVSALLAILAPLAIAIGFIASPISIITVAIIAFAGLLMWLISNFENFKTAAIAVWEAVRAAIVSAWEFIGPYIEAGVRAVLAIFTLGFSEVVLAVINNWETIKGAFVTAWEAIKTGVTDAWIAITELFYTGWLAVTEGVTAAWEAIKLVFTTAWEAIKTAITTAIAAIGTVITSFLTKIKEGFIAGWEAIKGVVVSVTGAIKESIGTFVGNVTEKFVSFFNDAKGKWGEFWDGISGVATGFMDGLGGVIDKVFGKISAVIDKMIELKNKAASALGMGGGSSTGGRASSGSRSATGGNRFAGQSVLVGENGPERVIFGRGANVIPNHRDGGGGGLTIQVNVTGNTMLADDRSIAESIGDLITQQFSMSNKYS